MERCPLTYWIPGNREKKVRTLDNEKTATRTTHEPQCRRVWKSKALEKRKVEKYGWSRCERSEKMSCCRSPGAKSRSWDSSHTASIARVGQNQHRTGHNAHGPFFLTKTAVLPEIHEMEWSGGRGEVQDGQLDSPVTLDHSSAEDAAGRNRRSRRLSILRMAPDPVCIQ